jgi:hypothetical protein
MARPSGYLELHTGTIHQPATAVFVSEFGFPLFSVAALTTRHSIWTRK